MALNDIRLIQGDCIEEMNKLIEDGIKVDLILTDPPFAKVRCKWDILIPIEPMWGCLKQLSKERTPTLLFNTEPFGSQLRMSNIKMYKYDLIWDKEVGTNFLNANRMPMPSHENISIFYQKLPKYNPQKRYVGIIRSPKHKDKIRHQTYGKVKEAKDWVDDGYRFPLSVIHCNKYHTEARNGENLHPTQKPVKLLEYLIKTYSDEGDVVLDFTMGSGSTGVACKNTNRKFIGIELDNEYFNIAKTRINNYQTKLL